MHKNDRLFCASILVSLIMIGSIMMDNASSPRTVSVKADRISQAHQRILDLKLPLHEGKHWRHVRE